jgi:hypothetical protein
MNSFQHLLSPSEAATLIAAQHKPRLIIDEEPAIDSETLREANERHDREHGDPFVWARGWDRSKRKK